MQLATDLLKVFQSGVVINAGRLLSSHLSSRACVVSSCPVVVSTVDDSTTDAGVMAVRRACS
jgi:hypothetical protein